MALWESQLGDHTSDWLRAVLILAAKEVDIGLDEGNDKTLRPADMLFYSWDRGLDVCVDLAKSPPLMQAGMKNIVPGRAVIDMAHCKRVKYETKCEAIDMVFSVIHSRIWGN
nr:hypothetical protein [Tanacetum cinerariifolium]